MSGEGQQAPAESAQVEVPASLEEQLLLAAADGDADEVARLIELEADIDFQNEEGVSALMKAAEAGHTAVLAALLGAGAPWNAQDQHGYCAGEAVMMGWERPLMLRHAALICPGAQEAQEQEAPGAQEAAAEGEGPSPSAAAAAGPVREAEPAAGLGPGSEGAPTGGAAPKRRGGGHVVNVGFGLGIIDTAIQSHHPERHTIIEAHPDVLAHMEAGGWMGRPGVRVLRGRWQEVLPALLAEAPYDGIFFDTYGEYYEEMREFHAHLPRLLAPHGVYSFFNGLAPDNIFFHMVYC
ncbi:Arginine N-methyltransferase 2, partial [Tetrabaena socialis]